MKLKIKYFLLGCISLLALASCIEIEEEREPTNSENENVVVKLTAVVDNKEFSTDSEVVPMRATQSILGDYNVAYIAYYTMVIIKKVSEEDYNQSRWAIEEIQTFEYNNYITTKDGFKAIIQQTLRPGKYKFLLLLNGLINNELQEGTTFTENDIPWLTDMQKDYAVFDIFFAIKDVNIDKKEALNEDNSLLEELTLKRHSSLIRFAFEGDKLFPALSRNSTIEYEEMHTISGLDLFGQDVQNDRTQSIPIQCIITKKSYLTNSEYLYFSSFESEDKLINLLSHTNKKGISLTIKSIGKVTLSQPYSINVMALKNRITTILLHKADDSSGNISHTIQEKAPDDWASRNNIPWEFVELNN